jgi:hypothetical protein
MDTDEAALAIAFDLWDAWLRSQELAECAESPEDFARLSAEAERFEMQLRGLLGVSVTPLFPRGVAIRDRRGPG